MRVDRRRLGNVLFGSSRLARYGTVASALILGVALLGIYPSLPVEYWLVPGTVDAWLFHAAFASVAFAAAVAGAGLLAAWFVTYPAVAAIYYYELLTGPAAGFVVLPVENGLLTVLLIAAVPALAYGSVGYVLGAGVRRLVKGAPSKAARRIRN